MNASFTEAQETATCLDAAMSTAETGGGEEEEVEGASLLIVIKKSGGERARAGAERVSESRSGESERASFFFLALFALFDLTFFDFFQRLSLKSAPLALTLFQGMQHLLPICWGRVFDALSHASERKRGSEGD